LGLESFDLALALNAPFVAIANMDWASYAGAYPAAQATTAST